MDSSSYSNMPFSNMFHCWGLHIFNLLKDLLNDFWFIAEVAAVIRTKFSILVIKRLHVASQTPTISIHADCKVLP